MQQPEAWMRGPFPGIPPLLQPVAHTLLQVREDVQQCTAGLGDDLLWVRPASAASAGFHLMHLTGFLDRLFTYARGEKLSAEQFAYLAAEGNASDQHTTAALVEQFVRQIDLALKQLAETDAATLTDYRGVGRHQLPATVMGLLFHAAEHASRHLGQLLVTVKIVAAKD